MRTYGYTQAHTHEHTAFHSAPSLEWEPQEECEKMCHLSIHSSTSPSQVFVFHYEKKSIFQFKCPCAQEIAGKLCFLDQFTSSNWSLSWSMLARTYPPTHIEVRWKADWNFSCTNISVRQSLASFEQDLSQWIEPRTTYFIFHHFLFCFGYAM